MKNTRERVLAKRCNKLRVYSQTYRTDMYLNNRRKGLDDPNSLREEVDKLLINDPVPHNADLLFIELKFLSVVVLCIGFPSLFLLHRDVV